MHKEKAIGLDGFNMAFFKAWWPFEYLMKVFNELYYNEKRTTSMNSTFITLKPKKNSPMRCVI